MKKLGRRNNIGISLNSGSELMDDVWLNAVAERLNKEAVQPRKDTLFDQINSIVNNTQSKFKTVDSIVKDMQERSGYSVFVKKMQETNISQKVAKKAAAGDDIPELLKNKNKNNDNDIKTVLDNKIKSSKGLLATPVLIESVKELCSNIYSPNDAVWEDRKLLEYIHKLNMDERDKNHSKDDYSNVGNVDTSPVDDQNDFFGALMPKTP